MQPTSRPARLEARLAPEVMDMLRRAAEIEGRSLTDFVVTAARAAAEQTISRSGVLDLHNESARAFAAMLADPPPPAPAMERARQHHERLIGPL